MRKVRCFISGAGFSLAAACFWKSLIISHGEIHTSTAELWTETFSDEDEFAGFSDSEWEHNTAMKIPMLRWLDENDENNNDEQGQQQQQNEEEEQQQQNRDRGPGNDDYFGDYIQDDLVQDDYTVPTKTTNYDDFYVFERDRTPHLVMDTRTVIAFLTASLALTLGASSGTGGGGMIVPIYILILGLPIQVAIPIGAVTVLGGSSASTSLNWTRRHPLADRVLIDWDLILVMEPLVLVGALLGTLFHRVLSEKVLVVLLVLLLSITAHTTLSKAMRMYQAEIRYIRYMRASHAAPPISGSPTSLEAKIESWGTIDPMQTQSLTDENNANMSMDKSLDNAEETTTSDASRTTTNHPDPSRRGNNNTSRKLDAEEKEAILIINPDFVTLRSELIEQEKFTPRSKIIALLCMFAVLTFLNIMVGGGAYKSPWDIVCGSVAFWVVHIIMVVFLIASAWAAQTYVVARHEIKELVRFDYVHGDIKWDARSAILYPAVFVTAGLFAGTLGIGGGVITVPIMLAMGVHPGVVSATSSAMIFFTSLASTTSFFVFGLILKDFAIFAFFVGFVATFIGQLIMRYARQAKSASGRTFERNSFTAFAIGGVVLVSALLMTIEYVFTIVEQPDSEVGLCDGLRL